MIVSTQRQLTHADLCRYEELLHGHRVHVGEVLRHKLLAIVPVAWRKEKGKRYSNRKRNAICKGWLAIAKLKPLSLFISLF